MVIWPMFLIALYWSSQYVVETEPLANKHLEEAILCLREYIGEDIVHATFRNLLTYGEYLGDICKYEEVDIIEKKIKKNTKNGGIKIQECLANKDLPDVYTQIRDHGVEVLENVEKPNKLEEEYRRSRDSQPEPSFEVELNLEENMSEEKNNDKVVAFETPETSTSKDTELEDTRLTLFLPGTDVTGVHESHKVPGKDSNEANTEKYSDFGKYVIGLCRKDDTINFQELENDEDKETAFYCLEDCATKFMMRIESSLDTAKEEIVKIMGKDQKELLRKTVDFKNVTDSERILVRRKYDDIINDLVDQTMIDISIDSLFGVFTYKKRRISKDDSPSSSARIFDINEITKAGKILLTRYSQVYRNLYKYLSKSDLASDKDLDDEVKKHLKAIRSMTDDEESLNNELRDYFIYYTSCAKVECYMKAPESVPLYTLIHEEASQVDPEQEQELSPELKFYLAFTRQVDYGSDDNEDDD